MSRRKEPAIPADLLDQLLAGSDAASALQQGGLLDLLKKALAERALNAEMDYHLATPRRPETVVMAMAARRW
jgi:transposase-like protein